MGSRVESRSRLVTVQYRTTVKYTAEPFDSTAKMAARKRAGSGTGEAVGFGVAQANAYFNARRMGRRAPTKAKSKTGAKAREAEPDQEEDEEDEKLVLPPPSALRAILRSADERDAKRQRVKHELPSMQVAYCASC